MSPAPEIPALFLSDAGDVLVIDAAQVVLVRDVAAQLAARGRELALDRPILPHRVLDGGIALRLAKFCRVIRAQVLAAVGIGHQREQPFLLAVRARR